MRNEIVVVLGAGASTVFGFPAQNQIWDFLERSSQTNLRRDILKGFQLVYGADIEQAFTMLELNNRTLSMGGAIGPHHNTQEYTTIAYLKHMLYEAFVNFEISEEGRLLFSKLIQMLRVRDGYPTVLSLNWDTSLEQVLVGMGIPFSYHLVFDNLDIEDRSKAIPLLKLHGSMNWSYCRYCSRFCCYNNQLKSKVVDYRLIEAESEEQLWEFLKVKSERERKGIPPPSPHEDIAREYASGWTTQIVCPSCEALGADIVLVPPSMPKGTAGWSSSDWRVASSKLKKAKTLIVIGYSFRDADMDVRYLLESSINGLSLIDKVIVFDTPAVAEKVRDIINRRQGGWRQKFRFECLGFLTPDNLHKLREVLY